MEIFARFFITFEPNKIQTCLPPQNDCLNLSFVKDIMQMAQKWLKLVVKRTFVCLLIFETSSKFHFHDASKERFWSKSSLNVMPRFKGAILERRKVLENKFLSYFYEIQIKEYIFYYGRGELGIRQRVISGFKVFAGLLLPIFIFLQL